MLAGAATSVAACAAILGIEDRLPLSSVGGDGGEGGGGEGSVDGGSDSPITDAPLDIPTIPDAECTTATCAAVGGSCVGGACQLTCDACAGTTVTCPPNTDCQLLCGETNCDNTTCAGGHSCTFECTVAKGCKGVRCEGERCAVRCPADDTCANAECDASVSCRFECSGKSACDKEPGIGGSAGETCEILCTGPSSCGGGGGGNPPTATIRCNAPDSGIVCGNAADTCKDSVIYCSGQKCTIDCQGATSCEDGYCCDAGTTCVKLGLAATNRCP